MIVGFESIVYLVISLLISLILILITRKIINSKFSDIEGSQKLIGIISIVIALSEVAFLGVNFGLLDFALEIITTVGVGMVFLAVAFQHQLKNIVAGIGLFFSHEVNVGDIVQIKEERGTIIELHLTKTIALTEEGERLVIPNQKFAEEVVKLRHASRKDPFSK